MQFIYINLDLWKFNFLLSILFGVVSFLTLFMHMPLPKIFVIVWEDGGYKDRHGQTERKANQLWRHAHRLALLNYTCVIASLCLK